MSLHPRVRADRPPRATPQERLAQLPARAAALLGDAWPAPAPASTGAAASADAVVETVLTYLDATTALGAGTLATAAALATDALELADLARRQSEGQRRALTVAVDESLDRMRRFQTSAELVDAVCGEIARACRFDRVLLGRIVDGAWHPWMASFARDEAAERAVLAEADAGIPLERLPTESAVLASRRPTIVAGTSAFPLAVRSRSRTYVVAPLTPAGRVVGFVHADHGAEGPPVDETDRDILWTFAEAFGRIFERAVLLEPMALQRAHVRDSFDVVESFMTGLAASDIELVPHDDPLAPQDADRTSASDASVVIDRLLTEREREVMNMILRGCTNQVIAERLVIKEGTVKSHVKHILRKVGAANRTEAISRYAGTLEG